MVDKVEISFGGGFLGLLAIAFIVLKLCEVIDWSWWWVLAPLWIPIAISFAILIIIFLIWCLAGLIEGASF